VAGEGYEMEISRLKLHHAGQTGRQEDKNSSTIDRYLDFGVAPIVAVSSCTCCCFYENMMIILVPAF